MISVRCFKKYSPSYFDNHALKNHVESDKRISIHEMTKRNSAPSSTFLERVDKIGKANRQEIWIIQESETTLSDKYFFISYKEPKLVFPESICYCRRLLENNIGSNAKMI